MTVHELSKAGRAIMTHTFKVGEPQITRGGQEAVIWSDEGYHSYPLLGGVRNPETKNFNFVSWDKNGKQVSGRLNDNDLMPPTPKKHKQVVWLNAYRRTNDGTIYFVGHETEKSAKQERSNICISTFFREIEFEEGEGL